MTARALILDAHAAVLRSLHARTRPLQLKHGHQALELLKEAVGRLPRDPIPEAASFPENTAAGVYPS